MVEERGLVEGDAAAHGARGEEALRLLVVTAGHRQAVGLIDPDGDLCQSAGGEGRQRRFWLLFPVTRR